MYSFNKNDLSPQDNNSNNHSQHNNINNQQNNNGFLYPSEDFGVKKEMNENPIEYFLYGQPNYGLQSSYEGIGTGYEMNNNSNINNSNNNNNNSNNSSNNNNSNSSNKKLSSSNNQLSSSKESAPTKKRRYVIDRDHIFNWIPYCRNYWNKLITANGVELPPPTLSILAEKGFSFSEVDNSWVYYRRNHFQLGVTIQHYFQFNESQPPFVSLNNNLYPVDNLYLCIRGVKNGPDINISEEVEVELYQTNSKREKTEEKLPPPVLMTNHTALTIPRLHFRKATANNARKHKLPNPQQEFFRLVLTVVARSQNRDFCINSIISDPLIVRTGHPTSNGTGLPNNISLASPSPSPSISSPVSIQQHQHQNQNQSQNQNQNQSQLNGSSESVFSNNNNNNNVSSTISTPHHHTPIHSMSPSLSSPIISSNNNNNSNNNSVVFSPHSPLNTPSSLSTHNSPHLAPISTKENLYEKIMKNNINNNSHHHHHNNNHYENNVQLQQDKINNNHFYHQEKYVLQQNNNQNNNVLSNYSNEVSSSDLFSPIDNSFSLSNKYNPQGKFIIPNNNSINYNANNVNINKLSYDQIQQQIQQLQHLQQIYFNSMGISNNNNNNNSNNPTTTTTTTSTNNYSNNNKLVKRKLSSSYDNQYETESSSSPSIVDKNNNSITTSQQYPTQLSNQQQQSSYSQEESSSSSPLQQPVQVTINDPLTNISNNNNNNNNNNSNSNSSNNNTNNNGNSISGINGNRWATNNDGSLFHFGNVGVNSESPQEALSVNGNVQISGIMYQPSDKRVKSDIVPVSSKNQLENIMKLKIYDYKLTEEWVETTNLSEDQDRGVLAQELKQTNIPNAVKETGDRVLDNGKVIKDFLVVNKDAIFLENVGATQELSKKVDNVCIELEELDKNKIEALGNKMSELERKTIKEIKKNQKRKKIFISIGIVTLLIIFGLVAVSIILGTKNPITKNITVYTTSPGYLNGESEDCSESQVDSYTCYITSTSGSTSSGSTMSNLLTQTTGSLGESLVNLVSESLTSTTSNQDQILPSESSLT